MTNEEVDERSWKEYRRLVVAELERIDKGLQQLNTKLDDALTDRDKAVNDIRVAVGMLQVKCGLWGALSGSGITVAILLLRIGTGH